MQKSSFINYLFLFLAALVWGLGFVSQSVGANYLSAFAFNALRFPLAFLVLIPLLLVRKKTNKSEYTKSKGMALTGGILCGIMLFLASTFQQLAMTDSSTGKAGFITAFYIVLVPIFGLFVKKRTNLFIWIAVILALIGLFFLCIKDSFTLSTSDISLFICAALYALHILIIDYFSPMVDSVLLSWLQFAVTSICSLLCMFIFEGAPSLSNITSAAVPILYAGIMSCGIGYTFQIIGQNNVNPAIASVLLSLESCMSAIAGALILGQLLSLRELIGCIFMFAAVLITQINPPKKSRTSS